MASFLVPLNDEEMLKMWAQFKKLAHREEKPAVQLVREVLQDYIKKHAEGNPNFPLDLWATDSTIKAFPTTGETWTHDRLSVFGDRDLEELADEVKKRAQEITHEAKERGKIWHWELP